jgi:hypothetical protein
MLKCYAIFDKKALSFATPFFAVNDEVAMRSFEDLVRDRRSLVSQHPEDFALHFVGHFEPESGKLLMRQEVEGTYLVEDGLQAYSTSLARDKQFRTMTAQFLGLSKQAEDLSSDNPQ